MAQQPKKPDEDKLSYWGRVGSLGSGFVLIGLGAADAMFDPFPGPETALFTAGVALVVIGVTGKKPKSEG
jgi:hypothetical protein